LKDGLAVIGAKVRQGRFLVAFVVSIKRVEAIVRCPLAAEEFGRQNSFPVAIKQAIIGFEIDARPSDCIVLATQAKAPIFVSQDVWEETEDRSDELEKIRQALREKKGQPPGPIFGDDIV